MHPTSVLARTLFFSAVASVTVSACLSGCAKSDDQVLTNANQVNTPTGLSDQWKSKCAATPLALNLFGLNAFTRELDIGTTLGSSLGVTTVYYNEGDCTAPAVTVVENGSATLGDQTSTAATALDARIESVSITANSGAGKDKLNFVRFCGISDWQVGAPRDVTSATQNGDIVRPPCWASSPRNIYDIEAVEGDTLKIGLDINGLDKSAPEKRPTELETTMTYHRVR